MQRSLKEWDTYHTKGIRKQYLFRYGAEWKLKSFLENKALYLSKMSDFDDKLEGISTYDITQLRVAYEFCFVDSENDVNPDLLEDWKRMKGYSARELTQINKKITDSQKAHFTSCWFNSDRESDAMWRLYNSDEMGFAIKLDRKELQESVKKSVSQNITNNRQAIVAGRVKYQNFLTVIDNEKNSQVRYLGFRKDESFAHEREYRVVMIDLNREAVDEKNKLFKLLNFDKLNITVIANPKMLDSIFKEKKKYYESLYENVKIIKSELEPFYRLPDRIKELRK